MNRTEERLFNVLVGLRDLGVVETWFTHANEMYAVYMTDGSHEYRNLQEMTIFVRGLMIGSYIRGKHMPDGLMKEFDDRAQPDGPGRVTFLGIGFQEEAPKSS